MNPTSPILSYDEGETLNLVISATGYPSPEVKCGQENNTEATDIKNGKSSSIHVSELKYSLHNGINYQCTASNANGSTTWNFSLNILRKCMCRYLHKLFLHRV